MAKKALVSMNIPVHENGYRVNEVVDAENVFEVDSSLQWIECPDYVEMSKYWYSTVSNTFKKLPDESYTDLGALAQDEEGNVIEEYVWDWDLESWSKQSI